MTIPQFLKIGGHTYQVVLTNDQSLLEGAQACMDEREGTIWIDNTAPQTVQESSLIHEIFHALNATLSEGDLGHALIESLSEQFYQVLHDNQLI